MSDLRPALDDLLTKTVDQSSWQSALKPALDGLDAERATWRPAEGRNSIHMIVRYRELLVRFPDDAAGARVWRLVKSLVWPCLFTATTTGAGFLSLQFAGSRPIIDFGVLMSLGVIENPITATKQKNLNNARMLLDDLEMLQAKTEGNLDPEETEHLEKMLRDLGAAYEKEPAE